MPYDTTRHFMAHLWKHVEIVIYYLKQWKMKDAIEWIIGLNHKTMNDSSSLFFWLYIIAFSFPNINSSIHMCRLYIFIYMSIHSIIWLTDCLCSCPIHLGSFPPLSPFIITLILALAYKIGGLIHYDSTVYLLIIRFALHIMISIIIFRRFFVLFLLLLLLRSVKSNTHTSDAIVYGLITLINPFYFFLSFSLFLPFL